MKARAVEYRTIKTDPKIDEPVRKTETNGIVALSIPAKPRKDFTGRGVHHRLGGAAPGKTTACSRVAIESSTPPRIPRVVIVGGGYAGQETAKGLLEHPPLGGIEVVVIDKNDDFVHRPRIWRLIRRDPRTDDTTYVSAPLKVDWDLTLPGQPQVLAAGDAARFDQNGKPVPGLRNAAEQMGRHAALTILRQIDGQDTQTFQYTPREKPQSHMGPVYRADVVV